MPRYDLEPGADCCADGCPGHYQRTTPCTCNVVSNPPCASCEAGDLACDACGEPPPCIFGETTADTRIFSTEAMLEDLAHKPLMSAREFSARYLQHPWLPHR